LAEIEAFEILTLNKELAAKCDANANANANANTNVTFSFSSFCELYKCAVEHVLRLDKTGLMGTSKSAESVNFLKTSNDRYIKVNSPFKI
jgi:hypothetical protein